MLLHRLLLHETKSWTCRSCTGKVKLLTHQQDVCPFSEFKSSASEEETHWATGAFCGQSPGGLTVGGHPPSRLLTFRPFAKPCGPPMHKSNMTIGESCVEDMYFAHN